MAEGNQGQGEGQAQGEGQDQAQGEEGKTALTGDNKAGEGQAQGEDGKTALTGAGEDGKSEDGKSEDGKSEDGEDGEDEAQGAPETYEDFTLPDGVQADETQMSEFKDLAKSMNLTQEQAQQLVDFEANRTQAAAEQQLTQWQEITDGWLKSAKQDPEIGGAKYDKALEQGKAFLAKYGSPQLMKALDDLGFGNHPEFIRLAARAGKVLAEDTASQGRSAGSTPSQAARIFPDMPGGA